MTYSSRSLKIAGKYLGMHEWAGAQHNPKIVQMWKDIGQGWIVDDETPWCAAFVGSILGQAGAKGTGKANARSYLTWGAEVMPSDSIPGDVCVFWRGKPDGWKGHVAFLIQIKNNRVWVRGARI